MLTGKELGDALADAIKKKGVSKAEVARHFGVTPPSVQDWIKFGRISKIHIQPLLTYFSDVVGPEHWGFPPQGIIDASMRPLEAWDESTPLNVDDVELPYYKEVCLAAGNGCSHAVEIWDRKLRFSKQTLKAAGVDIENAICATATGNSMEDIIHDGTTIGIDRGRTQIKDGKIYAIDHDGMLRVKYVYRLPGGGIRLRSHNSEEYQDEVYSGDDVAKIRILGWVFWWSTIATW